MVIPDLNLLIYAYNQAADEHEAARSWWEALLSDDAPVGIPWVVTLGFTRLMSHPKVLTDPLPVEQCLAHVTAWFECPNVLPLEPGPRHWSIFSGLLTRLRVGGNLVTDTHLAVLAIEHNAELHSNDTDFKRFQGLRLRNPLV